MEGVATAAIVSFVHKARPEMVQGAVESRPVAGHPLRNVFLAFLAAAFLAGGVASWFSSGDPDGLEWSIANITGRVEPEVRVHGVHRVLALLQRKIAFLPEYSFRTPEERKSENTAPREDPAREGGANPEGGGRLGTSVSGIVGSTITLALVFLAGCILKRRSRAA